MYMPTLFTLVTLSGPAISGLGLYFGWPILFWVGVFLAGSNLFFNLASGAMKFPLLPLLSALAGGLLATPWYFGAAVGVLVYTAIEGIGEFLPARFWR